MTDKQKIEDAIGLIVQYGGVDGAHHKAWVIDQVLLILAGDEYDEVVRTICAGDDHPILTRMLTSPLRYPGGKSRAIKNMRMLMPGRFREYREPFVGGGSFFVYLRQIFPTLDVWINDLNPELYCFWKQVQANSERLAAEVRRIRTTRDDGRELFIELTSANTSELSELERAVRFFVLNRITFSGVVEAGGYSQSAFSHRFTESSIDRLAVLGRLLKGVRITCLDYRELLSDGNGDIFTFLDPPYYAATKSRLYGKKGILHTVFNHDEFAEEMRKCPHSWLITYDDSPEIRRNFDFANIYSWELQYGMNNYKQGKADKGKELFISNYALALPDALLNAHEQQDSALQLQLL